MKIKCIGGIYDEDYPIQTEKCLDCAKRYIDPPCGYTYPLLMAIIESQDVLRTGIHVSDIASCLRKSYYEFGLDKVIDLNKVMPLFRGKAIHELISRYNPYTTEVKVNNMYIAGTIDYIDEESIIDFKTTTKIPKRVLESHRKQVLYYWALSGGKKSPFINYIHAGNGKVSSKTFYVETMNKEVVLEEIRERSSTLTGALLSGTPPEGEPSEVCNYCRLTQDQCIYKE